MNLQIVSKIEIIEKELEELKSLIKAEAKKDASKKSDVSEIWGDKKIDEVKLSVAEGLRDYREGKVSGPYKNMKEFKKSLKKNS